MNKRTCGECKSRDYGTDTHYVCKNKKVLKAIEAKRFRVGAAYPACVEFSKKR